MGEIFLRNVKSLAALVAQLVSSTCGLIVTKSLKLRSVILERTLHSRFSLCTFFFISAVFIRWYLPEERSKIHIEM